MEEKNTLLLKIGVEGGFIEIMQDCAGSFIYNSVEQLSQGKTSDAAPISTESLPALEAAINRMDISQLAHGVILYVEPECEFDIKRIIHQRIKNL